MVEKSDEETKTELAQIISKGLSSFSCQQIKSVTRMGKANDKRKKLRLLLVTLQDLVQRDLIISRASEIKKKANINSFWINKDQNDSSKRRHALVKACYKLLLANAYPCSLKGSVITYGGRQYDFNSLNLLPDKCRPFDVKTRETEDGTALCFFSEHTYCSNFHSAKIKTHDYLFTSVEHAYQTLKVKDAGYTELATEMLGMVNPYSIKKVGDNIPPSKEWLAEIEELIRAKFQQNPKLLHLLANDSHT